MGQETRTSGGIILCGGESRRMGRDKAWLPVGGEPMLVRTARTLGEVVSPLVVVAAQGQPLPALDGAIEIVRDRQPGQGPLEGIAAGLRALRGRAESAYVTGVDVPLLQTGFIAAIISRLDDQTDIVLPCDAEHHHTLAAVYRLSVLPTLEDLLAGGERRPAALFSAMNTRRIEVEQLRAADPELLSLVNCNRPEDYRAALLRLGIG